MPLAIHRPPTGTGLEALLKHPETHHVVVCIQSLFGEGMFQLMVELAVCRALVAKGLCGVVLRSPLKGPAHNP